MAKPIYYPYPKYITRLMMIGLGFIIYGAVIFAISLCLPPLTSKLANISSIAILLGAVLVVFGRVMNEIRYSKEFKRN